MHKIQLNILYLLLITSVLTCGSFLLGTSCSSEDHETTEEYSPIAEEDGDAVEHAEIEQHDTHAEAEDHTVHGHDSEFISLPREARKQAIILPAITEDDLIEEPVSEAEATVPSHGGGH